MSKGSGSEKTREFVAKPPAAEGEHKKPDAKRPEGSSSRGKGEVPVGTGCVAAGCKKDSKRFNFCEEHYDHFKFGLIKKTGEMVSDYEKKIEHYTAYLAKQKASKRVA